MLKNYHSNPIIGIYYYPHPEHMDDALIAQDLAEVKNAHLRSIWLFFDPFYEHDAVDRLRTLLDEAHHLELTIVPVLGQYLQLHDHPEVKIVNADGTTSDNPRYWNMGCFNHPTVLELASARAVGFLCDFGAHPALYLLDGKPLMSFAHETYFRNSVPEFGGKAMQPNCYCEHCLAAWRDYLAAHDLPQVEAPRTPDDPVVWQRWLDFHAGIIPRFLRHVIDTTKAQTPLWSTHELNDFYPASWQCVYVGVDWWAMGGECDFGHEDMYPLEFDHRYVCYVYDYAKDVMRSALGWDKLMTAHGQAFNSWLGYEIPPNSMSEQIYSCLAHDTLGLAWWGQWPWDTTPDERYRLLRQTRQYNVEYEKLVRQLAGFELERARIALLYSWTTMGQALQDDPSHDVLHAYMMLVQHGYPVDLVSEAQVAGGVLAARGYEAVLAMGASALPEAVADAICAFAEAGGLVIADYAPYLNDAFPPLFAEWRGAAETKPRIYTLPDGAPVPVQVAAASLNPPEGADIIARFEDGTPAICRFALGQGSVILAGSYLGWDYTNFPGYYDLAAMFPYHIRRDGALLTWLGEQLAHIAPPARSEHPDVEVALWRKSGEDEGLLLVINHLQEPVETTVHVNALPGIEPVQVSLEPLQGQAIRLNSRA